MIVIIIIITTTIISTVLQEQWNLVIPKIDWEKLYNKALNTKEI